MPLPVVLARPTLAVLIGWHREISARKPGLRRHMLVAMASAMVAVVAMDVTHFPLGNSDTLQIDPLRLIQAVTAQVAFRVAGSIIFSSGSVRGVATGVLMWLAGAMGLASGTGDGMLALMGTGLAVVILWMVRIINTPAHGQHDHGIGSRRCARPQRSALRAALSKARPTTSFRNPSGGE